MGLDTRSKARLRWVAAAAAPIVAVQVARLVSGTGPGHAAAAETPLMPPAASAAAVTPAAPVLTAEQRKALEWLSAHREVPADLPSPIDVWVPQVRVAAAPAAPNEPAPLPALRLGGVASRGKDVVASINNRLYAVGDEPVQGWTISAIDALQRTVRFERYDGKAFELTSSGLAESGPAR